MRDVLVEGCMERSNVQVRAVDHDDDTVGALGSPVWEEEEIGSMGTTAIYRHLHLSSDSGRCLLWIQAQFKKASLTSWTFAVHWQGYVPRASGTDRAPKQAIANCYRMTGYGVDA